MIPSKPIFKALLEHPKREEICTEKVGALLDSLENGHLYEDISYTIRDEACGLLADFIITLLNHIDFEEETNRQAIENTIKGYLRHGHFKP